MIKLLAEMINRTFLIILKLINVRVYIEPEKHKIGI
jgi:hypothetical protein